jgi:hypothetical protein
VRSKITIWLIALLLAVAVLGAGRAFAQTPVVPSTTVAGQPDDQAKLDPNDGEDKPKTEKPGAEAPKAEAPKAEAPKAEAPKAEAPKADKPKAEAPKAEAPKADKPKAEAPKADKPKAEAPKADKPKADKPKAEAPKAEAPKADKPKAEAPKAEAPKADKPKAEAPNADKPGKPPGDKPNPEKFKPAEPKPTTASPNPAQPKRALGGATSARPKEPGPEPPVDAAKPVSPRPKAAPFVAASPGRHVTNPAAERNRTAARHAASATSREWSGTSSARSGGDSVDATPVASGPAAVAPTRAPHLASAGVAAGAAASLDRQEPRGLILGRPPRDNVLTLLLAILLYAAGIAYVIRREIRRALGLETRRAPPAQRWARPPTAARGRKRVGGQFRKRLLRTRSSRPRARRSAPRGAPPPFENKHSRAVTFAFQATERSPASMSRTDNG